MSESWSPAQFLCPAMSRLTMNSLRTSNHGGSGASPDGGSVGFNFTGATSINQIRIQWTPILLDVLRTLGGTVPMYIYEETMDSMFQVCVGFSLGMDKSGVRRNDFSVIGTKCVTLLEAESEAALAALGNLQHGSLNLLVVDVSRTRCEDLEESCYRALTKASQVYQILQSLLHNWENCMYKAEICYSPARLEKIREKVQEISSNISPNVADQLVSVTRTCYLKLRDLLSEAEELKNSIGKACGRRTFFPRVPSLHDEVSKHTGLSPRVIKLCMKLVLQEMVMTLGWQQPIFKVVPSATGLYTCTTYLTSNGVHPGGVSKTFSVTGIKTLTAEDAIESSCKATILAMEIEKSIFLVDLNYNYREYAELHVTEAKEMVRLALFIGSKILGQWETMIHDICMCKEYCQRAAAEYLEEGADFLSKMMHSSFKAVTDLHQMCLADFQSGQEQFQNAMASSGE